MLCSAREWRAWESASAGLGPFLALHGTIAADVFLVSRSADCVTSTDFRAGHRVVDIKCEKREFVEKTSRFACHCKTETLSKSI